MYGPGVVVVELPRKVLPLRWARTVVERQIGCNSRWDEMMFTRWGQFIGGAAQGCWDILFSNVKVQITIKPANPADTTKRSPATNITAMISMLQSNGETKGYVMGFGVISYKIIVL